MSQGYVIQWKSKVNGRAGRGSKQFAKAEAERLATELNEEYPDILHEAIVAPPPRPEPRFAEGTIMSDSEEEEQPAALVGH